MMQLQLRYDEDVNVGSLATILKVQSYRFFDVLKQFVGSFTLSEDILPDTSSAPSAVFLIDFHFHEHWRSPAPMLRLTYTLS